MNWRGGRRELKEVLPFFRRVGKRIKKRTNAGFSAEWLLRYYFNQTENHLKWVLGLFGGSLRQIWAFLLPLREVRHLDSCAEDQKQTCTNPQNANNTLRCHNLSVVSQRVNVWTRCRAQAYVMGYYSTFTSRLENRPLILSRQKLVPTRVWTHHHQCQSTLLGLVCIQCNGFTALRAGILKVWWQQFFKDDDRRATRLFSNLHLRCVVSRWSVRESGAQTNGGKKSKLKSRKFIRFQLQGC